MSDPAELAIAPDDVLVQQWAVPAQGQDPFGRRVRQDGTVEVLPERRPRSTPNGEWTFGEQTLKCGRRVVQLEGPRARRDPRARP